MTVATVMDRLATICESIDGVESVYAGRPDDAPPSELPAVVILSGAGNYDDGSNGEGNSDTLVEKRQYRIILLVKNWLDDAEFEAERAVRPFYGRFKERFFGAPGLEHPKGLNSLAGVQKARLLSDSGTVNIILADNAYAGVEFILEAEEYSLIEFA